MKPVMLAGRKDVDILTRWPMYSEIHALKCQKFKMSQVASQLSLNPKTVAKYWDMSPEEFQKHQHRFRHCKMDRFQAAILARIKQFPDLSAAQIMDWIMENYGETSLRERTVRRYVATLRKKYHLPKTRNPRQYEAVEDPPPGYQLQVDFGQITVPTAYGTHITLYCMGGVLAHSRYKYAEWSDKPFTVQRFLPMLYRCFEYITGVPRELVFDQDKLVAVSENYGDVIYTEDFERFKRSMEFTVRLCRKSDPESKGKVEAVVKYLKYNFANHRMYTSLADWNQAQWDWLERTGNAKEHGTTKKVPAQVFLVEKQYLRPVPSTVTSEDIVSITVRKDNTVLYKTNRYSVPLGTYCPGRKLAIRESAGEVQLNDILTGERIAQHPLCHDRGQLIKNRHHGRDLTAKIDTIYAQTLAKLGDTEPTRYLLDAIRKEKRRYVRDQFSLLSSLAGKYPAELLQQAIQYCLTFKLYSAVDCRDAAAYYSSHKIATDEIASTGLSILPAHLAIHAEKRSLDAYASLCKGEGT